MLTDIRVDILISNQYKHQSVNAQTCTVLRHLQGIHILTEKLGMAEVIIK
jgi:hypothetical protein